jgi:uncharacterized protein (DUF1015 family)
MPKIKAFCAVTANWKTNEALVDAGHPVYRQESATFIQANDVLAAAKGQPESKEAVYIYELRTAGKSHSGVWALTAFEEFGSGRIRGHERVHNLDVEKIAGTRLKAGFDSSPVLMTYPADAHINELIELAKLCSAQKTIHAGAQAHLLWTVSDESLKQKLVNAFDRLGTAYLADGHHRLNGIGLMPKPANLEDTLPGTGPAAYFQGLYMADDQVSSMPCHQLFKPGFPIDPESFFQVIGKDFEIKFSPGNQAVEPLKAHHFGLYLNQQWYQLELRQETLREASFSERLDVNILYKYIVSPTHLLSGVQQGSGSVGGEHALRDLLRQLSRDRLLIAFTLCPVSINQLMAIGYLKELLPPKSTWIEPKVPAGLLVYHFNDGDTK